MYRGAVGPNNVKDNELFVCQWLCNKENPNFTFSPDAFAFAYAFAFAFAFDVSFTLSFCLFFFFYPTFCIKASFIFFFLYLD